MTLALLALPTAAFAAEEDPPTLVRLARHAKAKIRLVELYRGRGDMDGADAVRDYTTIAPSLRVPFARWGEVEVSAQYDVKHYDFDGTSDLVDGTTSGGTPFDALNNYVIRVGSNMRVSENTFWSMGLYSRAKWEEGANLGRATKMGGFGAMGIQLAPQLFIGFGAGTSTKFRGGNTKIGPVWTFHWQIVDGIEFRIRNTSAQLRMRVNERLQVRAISGYSERVYQLQVRGDDFATRLKESSIPAFLQFYWRATDRTQLEFDAGVLINQELETNALDSKQSIDQGVAAYVGFGVRFRN